VARQKVDLNSRRPVDPGVLPSLLLLPDQVVGEVHRLAGHATPHSLPNWNLSLSHAAGKAVAAGVVGQRREPYVPGSGARLPAELRLVLAGYVGVACGLFAGALACAAPLVFLFFFGDDDPVDDWIGLLFGLASMALAGGLRRGLGLGL
jgi:hypothetical protein